MRDSRIALIVHWSTPTAESVTDCRICLDPCPRICCDGLTDCVNRCRWNVCVVLREVEEGGHRHIVRDIEVLVDTAAIEGDQRVGLGYRGRSIGKLTTQAESEDRYLAARIGPLAQEFRGLRNVTGSLSVIERTHLFPGGLSVGFTIHQIGSRSVTPEDVWSEDGEACQRVHIRKRPNVFIHPPDFLNQYEAWPFSTVRQGKVATKNLPVIVRNFDPALFAHKLFAAVGCAAANAKQRLLHWQIAAN